MPRGRPKSIPPTDEYTSIMETKSADELVAYYLAKRCEIPGCIPRLHMDDAKNLVGLLRTKGYINKEG